MLEKMHIFHVKEKIALRWIPRQLLAEIGTMETEDPKAHAHYIHSPLGSRFVSLMDPSMPWTSYSDRTPLLSSLDTTAPLGSGSEFDIENKG